jgi:hypothetical protein
MTATAWSPSIASCDEYLGDRKGKYEYRAVRYRKAADWLFANGLTDEMTVVDLGAGMTEFDYTLRAEYGWRGRYIPIDGGIDGTDLNAWSPPRDAHFFVGLEIVEHLEHWWRFVQRVKQRTLVGIALSTPNPRTTDVLGMDPTHVCEVPQWQLVEGGFTVTEETFYGGVFSAGEPDSLFATWRRA